MKKIIAFIYIGLSILFFSCEKDVNITLNPTEPKLVIDASIQAGGMCLVNLTKSKDLLDNTPYQVVKGAIVTLTDEKGGNEILKEIVGGVYASEKIKGIIGVKYTLDINVDGKSHIGSSTIPPVVPIDSIYIYDIPLGSDSWYSPCIVYDDPANVPNYYYSTIFLNGAQLRSVYIYDDQYRDGLKKIEKILYYDYADNDDEDLKVGDHIMVEMQSIDKESYDYYKVVWHSAMGGSNPISRFTGDVLGNFKAYSSSVIEMEFTEDSIYRP